MVENIIVAFRKEYRIQLFKRETLWSASHHDTTFNRIEKSSFQPEPIRCKHAAPPRGRFGSGFRGHCREGLATIRAKVHNTRGRGYRETKSMFTPVQRERRMRVASVTCERQAVVVAARFCGGGRNIFDCAKRTLCTCTPDSALACSIKLQISHWLFLTYAEAFAAPRFAVQQRW